MYCFTLRNNMSKIDPVWIQATKESNNLDFWNKNQESLENIYKKFWISSYV